MEKSLKEKYNEYVALMVDNEGDEILSYEEFCLEEEKERKQKDILNQGSSDGPMC